MDEIDPRVTAHINSVSMQSQAQADATTPADAVIMDSTGSPLQLDPRVVRHMAEASGTPDITTALTDQTTPAENKNIPLDAHGVVDPYPGMGDYMDAPSLRSAATIMGLVNSDRDSLEGVLKKKGTKFERQPDGSVVIDEGKDGKFVFRNGVPQKGDILRGILGGATYGGANGLAAWATGGTSLLPQIISTMWANHFLGAAREDNGGAPASYLEDALAGATHGVIHGVGAGVGAAYNYARNMERVAPGILNGAEGIAIRPGETGAARYAAAPYAPPAPYAPAPLGPPPEVPPAPGAVSPKYVPKDPTEGLPPINDPAPLPPKLVGDSPAIQGLKNDADSVIRGSTPELDPSRANRGVLGAHTAEVERLKAISEPGYAKVDKEMLGRSARTEKTLRFIDQKAAEVGGHEKLPKWVKDIYNELSPKAAEGAPTERPTFHFLEQRRKRVGAMLDALHGPNPPHDVDEAYAKALFKSMSGDQESSLPTAELKKTYADAKAAKLAEYETNDKVKTLFGPQTDPEAFTGDLGSRMRAALKAMTKGESAPLVKLAAALPEHLRSDVLMNSISNMFGDVGAGEPPDLAKFGKWYNKVMTKESSKELLNNLTPEARDGLTGLKHIQMRIADLTSEEAQQRFAQEAQHELAQQAVQDARAARAALVSQAKAQMEALKEATGRLRIAQRQDQAVYGRDNLINFKGQVSSAAREAKIAVAEHTERMAEAARLIKEADAHVTAAQKEMAKPGLLRQGIGGTAKALSYFGDKLGVGSHLGDRFINGPVDRIMKTAAAEKAFKAWNMPTPRWTNALRGVVAAGLTGTPARSSGAAGKPEAQ